MLSETGLARLYISCIHFGHRPQSPKHLNITGQTCKNDEIPRSNKYSQNSTVIYREQLFRLDPSFSGSA